jgi:hypothetical protein
VVGDIERERQTSDSAADDQKIGVLRHGTPA